MQILFDTDSLIQALENIDDSAVLSLCRQKHCDGWVVSTSIPAILEGAGAPKVQSLLQSLAVLTPIANDIDLALGSEEPFEIALVTRLVKVFGLDAVVTLTPEKYSGLPVVALTPGQLQEKLDAPPAPVKEVRLLDITASYHQILNEVEKEMAETVRSGYFILGPKVSQMEERMASYCQTKYAVGVSSGTDALLIALMVAGVGPGDEVITSPYTFFATAGSIIRLGAKPVFADINDITFNIKPEHIERCITPKTKAIIPVHLYGQCADMDSILQLAEKNNLRVIEDAAQAIGSEYKGKPAGSIGDMGCFSFFPAKNLGSFGDGGMVTTNSEELYQQLKILRVHGSEPKYYHKVIGGNFRLDALQADVVSAKLNFLEDWTEKRRENAQTYNQLFKDSAMTPFVQLPPEVFPRHVYNQYVICAGNRRDELRTFLHENQIGCEIYYPVPLHLQDCFKSLGYKSGDFPASEKAARETLALPISHEVSRRQQEYVVNTIHRFFLGE
ncbi:MAG: DegT/DnrJ/EryC1/StrS family aminotransferase [Nitrospina sp.]|jgi:dTDP-4-amino-4,6-dideoxygalactose transaminase|nr:DegT/DnrJ/EryC1/StrS family aminotransferase [Nitrospina sp.]